MAVRGLSAGLKYFLLVVPLLAVLLVTRPAEARYASLIMDVDSGRIISSYDPDARKYPASLTKMMTLYMLFDALEARRYTLDSELWVSAYAARQPPTRIGLAPGAKITVLEAIGALVVRSANDVAAVVADNLGGGQPEFAAMMTRRARQLGMTRTTFMNPSGLPNLQQKTTARDLAKLARALIQNHGKYYHYFGVDGFDYRGTWISTHNNLLLNYPGADGLKTGFINASGFNLAFSAKQNGRRLIGVILGEETAWSRDTQMARLLDAAFERANDRRYLASAPSLDAGPAGEGGEEVLVASAEVPPLPTPAPVIASPASLPAMTSVVAPTVVDTRPRERTIPGLIAAAYAASESEADRKPEPPGLRLQPMLMPPPPERLRAEPVATRPTHRPAVPVEEGGDWAIQVGAFVSQDNARRAAREATTLLSSSAQTRVVPTQAVGGKTMYRAQLVGLSRSAADGACRSLSAKDRPCAVIQADARNLASAR